MKTTQAAKGLGWFSIGLGMTQLLAPGWLSRTIGVGERQRTLMRALGAREVLSGVGVLSRHQRKAGLWARVAGDVMDVALLTRALTLRRSDRGRVAGATASVLAIGVLDYLCARSQPRR